MYVEPSQASETLGVMISKEVKGREQHCRKAKEKLKLLLARGQEREIQAQTQDRSL